jgi:hypothetical protein
VARKNHCAPRPTTESRLAFDIREFFRAASGNTGFRALYRWNRACVGDLPVATLFVLKSPVLIEVKHVGGTLPNELLDVVYTPCRYGGRRAWLMCSRIGCGRRAGIVYDTAKGFRCRHCANLDYASHRERSWDRSLRRSRRLRMKLGGGTNLLENFPAKPKFMHWETYHRMLDNEASIWGGIRNNTVMRLKQHKVPSLPR